MKIFSTSMLFLVALLLLISVPAQSEPLPPDDPVKKPLVQFGSTANQIVSFTTPASTTTCDLCVGSGKVENISFVYSGPDNTTVTFQVSNPSAGVIKMVTVNDGDIITIDASTIAGRDHIGNNVQIIIAGVNGGNPIPIAVNEPGGGTKPTEKGGTAFHTSCSSGTPEVGDVITSTNTTNVYSFEVIGGGNQGNPNACPAAIIDLACDATVAPLLDFENLTRPNQAPEGGDELKFTVPFTNDATNASATATNVEVTVLYDDSQFTLVTTPPDAPSGGDSQDFSTSGQIVYTIASLGVGSTVNLTFNLIVKSGATSGNVSATVTAADEVDFDSTPGGVTFPTPQDDECATTFANLPVELTAFDAQADGRSATLSWRTASETNNAGFELQHRYLDEAGKSNAAFTARAFIEGHGTTTEAQSYSFRLDNLEPGRHVFRLKQIDYDGTFDYSPEIEIAVDLPEAFLVSPVYPNPFNPQASFSFSVSRSQQVSVSVYNMLGQRVLTLFDGVAAQGTARTLQIDGSGLESGTYIVRVLGESFVNTQTMTLVK